MRTLIPSMLFLLASTSTALADDHEAHRGRAHRGRAMEMRLQVRSDAFRNDREIPMQYTCDGAATAPPISWSRVPDGTQSIALMVIDSDAPGGQFTHWLVTDIPADVRYLPTGGALPDGARSLANDKGDEGYAAPCPPQGSHHYIFRVFALDMPLRHHMNKDEFNSAIKGHVLAQGELIGLYHHRGREMRRHRDWR